MVWSMHQASSSPTCMGSWFQTASMSSCKVDCQNPCINNYITNFTYRIRMFYLTIKCMHKERTVCQAIDRSNGHLLISYSPPQRMMDAPSQSSWIQTKHPFILPATATRAPTAQDLFPIILRRNPVSSYKTGGKRIPAQSAGIPLLQVTGSYSSSSSPRSRLRRMSS